MNNYNDFYLTLVSNSSSNYFPENTTTHFCTQLPKTVHLDGEWCVGLSEIQYPYSFLTVNSGENIIYCTYQFSLSTIIQQGEKGIDALFNDVRCSAWIDEQVRRRKYKSSKEFMYDIKMRKFTFESDVIVTKYKTKIEAGNYETIESILEALNSLRPLVIDNVQFRLNDGSKRIIVTCSSLHLSSLSFSPTLSLQLGFKPDTNVLNKTSTHPANILLGLPSQLFVYSDIIEPQLVGDILAKVIRTVVINNKYYIYGTHHTQIFSHPHYVPVLKREFENIEIDIRSSTGEKVPFQFGTLCVKLHFKKIA
nr:PREDICTED: uncharacterized protein LOC107398959 [Tribolium castaneum]|eukprot:XP_015840030.1 PREDICTED: uncharacterized protein LOC107398959 [Tribolium castaneum]